MVRAIINADDFGISEQVNEAICLSFEKRVISNTTLMVNMPYASDAVKMAKEQGFYDRVGLHLNLTAGTPLTYPIRSLDRFCDKKGDFTADFHLHTSTRMHLSGRESQALWQEVEAQIRRYLAFGLPEKHLDSHHHVHTDLAVWRVIEPLLKKYSFRSVRLSRNIYAGGKCSTVNRLYKGYFNSRVRKTGVKTTDYFGSYADASQSYDSLKDNSLLEIMVHPMFSEDGELYDTKTPMADVGNFIVDRRILLSDY